MSENYELRKRLVAESKARLEKLGLELKIFDSIIGGRTIKGHVVIPTSKGEITWSFRAGKLSGTPVVPPVGFTDCLHQIVQESLIKLSQVAAFHPRGSRFENSQVTDEAGFFETTEWLEVPLAVNDGGVAVICLELSELYVDMDRVEAIRKPQPAELPSAVQKLLRHLYTIEPNAFRINMHFVVQAILYSLTDRRIGSMVAYGFQDKLGISDVTWVEKDWIEIYWYFFSNRPQNLIETEIRLYVEKLQLGTELASLTRISPNISLDKPGGARYDD